MLFKTIYFHSEKMFSLTIWIKENKNVTMTTLKVLEDLVTHHEGVTKSYNFDHVKISGPKFSVNTEFLKMLSDFITENNIEDGQNLISNGRRMVSALESDKTGRYSEIFSTTQSSIFFYY